MRLPSGRVRTTASTSGPTELIDPGPVLAWGVPRMRDLPWRRERDPWTILVAEVMLQQTQVDRVIPKWEAFLGEFPTPARCASASLGDVLRLWQGLGYPRRAKYLHADRRARHGVERRASSRFPRRVARAARHRPVHRTRRVGVRVRARRGRRRHEHRSRPRSGRRRAPDAEAGAGDGGLVRARWCRVDVEPGDHGPGRTGVSTEADLR